MDGSGRNLCQLNAMSDAERKVKFVPDSIYVSVFHAVTAVGDLQQMLMTQAAV